MRTPSLRPGGALRAASNVAVAICLLVGVAIVIDWGSISLGNAPIISCAVVPFVGIVAPPAGVVTTCLGLASALLTRQRGFGVALLVAGLILWQLPELVGSVLAPRC